MIDLEIMPLSAIKRFPDESNASPMGPVRPALLIVVVGVLAFEKGGVKIWMLPSLKSETYIFCAASKAMPKT